MNRTKKVKTFWNGTMRVLITLLSCALVSVLAMEALSQYISRELKKNAYESANFEAIHLKTAMNAIFLSTDWIINSFLCGMTDFENIDNPDGSVSTKYILPEKNRKQLEVDDLYDKMQSFLSYNQTLPSAVFIFEPGVISDAPDGVAAMIHFGESKHYSLLEYYDVFESDFYKQIKAVGKPFLGAGKNSENDNFVITKAVPLYDEGDKVIGELWIDASTTYISAIIDTYNSDKDMLAFIISGNNDLVVSSSDKDKYGGFDLREAMNEQFGDTVPEDWYENLYSQNTEDSCSFHSAINGVYYWTYLYPLLNSPFKLLVIKSENLILDKQTRFVWRFWGIAVSFLFLLCLFLMYLFRAFKRNNEARRRMQSELDVASKIQCGILPPNEDNSSHPFDIYGFQRPARSVGGDLYCYEKKGKFLHFCIGDVSGKGVPAALVMAELCSLYTFIIQKENNAANIMKSINDAVMEHDDGRMFCTLFIGVLNLETGELEFCNAGHNPPVLISKSGLAKFVRIKPNMPVYAYEGYDYQKESLILNPGDRLVLYTDGITEAKNGKSEFLGNEALLSALDNGSSCPLKQVVDKVLESIDTFVADAEQHDDITMLCVEYKKLF